MPFPFTDRFLNLRIKKRFWIGLYNGFQFMVIMVIRYPKDSKSLFLSLIGGTIVAVFTHAINFMTGIYDQRMYVFWGGSIALMSLFYYSINQYNSSSKKE